MTSLSTRNAGGALALVVGALLAGAACGADDDVRSEGTSTTTPSVDARWFLMAPVQAVSEAPCVPGQTRSQDGATCYQLADGIDGSAVERASIVEDVGPCGPAPTDRICMVDGSMTTQPNPGTWSVSFVLTDMGIDRFNAFAFDCHERASTCPTGQVAIVVDDEVMSAPTVEQPEFEKDGFVLSGDFDRPTAEEIAGRLTD